MDDLSLFCCLNKDCSEFAKRGAGNLTVPHRHGPEKSKRILRCRVCKSRFSERKGTPLFDARLPAEKVESVACRPVDRVAMIRESASRSSRGSTAQLAPP